MSSNFISLASWGRVLALAVLTIATSWATTVVPPEFPTLVNESDCIVHAVTRQVTTEKRPSARGVKIVTLVQFEVVETIAGSAPAQLTLEFLGGRVGDEVLTVQGMPVFKAGDEDILFVRDNGKSICPLYAMMHGRYAVNSDSGTGRKFITRTDGAGLLSVAQIATPLAERSASGATAANALTPDTFIQQIKAAVRPDARFNRVQP